MYGQRLQVLVTSVLALALVGCGGDLLEKGERLVTTEEMKVTGESVWEDGTTEAFTSRVPPGTEFEMLYTQKPGLDIIEVKPIEVEGVTDTEKLRRFFLPPHLRERFGFKRYSITLNITDLGEKYRRKTVEGAQE